MALAAQDRVVRAGFAGGGDLPGIEQRQVRLLPVRATAGLRGLLTQKLALRLAAGYGYGFYASGAANTSGFGDVILVGELNYIMSMTTAAGLGYTHEFQNSPLVGDFYNVDAVYGALRELVAGRVAVSASGRFEYRNYYGTEAGVKGRTDKLVSASLTADDMIQRVFYLGVGYTLSFASTNNLTGVDYTKHVIVGRLGVFTSQALPRNRRIATG